MSESALKLQQVIAQCQTDASLKQRFMAEPAAILKAAGVHVPEGVKINVVENTAQEITLVIPAPVSDVTDDALAGVAGGLYSVNAVYRT
ncbi:hypothetical protein MASR1M60_09530 [Rhodocyclaceae bacterium]